MNARADFPLIAASKGVYLDNAATAQKPRCVIEAESRYYETLNANVHRGVHSLSRLATEAQEAARRTVAQFLHAPSEQEIIFTSGCTEGINLIAQSLTHSGLVRAGEEILVSTDSHHSNIVPWQMLCERTGARLRPIPLREDLSFDTEAYLSMLSEHTRLVAVPATSNALGLHLPVREIISAAKQAGALTLVDAAQSIAHEQPDVRALGCDFLAFSGHKIYAPTGTGILWGRAELLEQLPPWKGGGEMISEVTFARTTYNHLPFKYEAGTPNIAGNIVLAEALRYVQSLGLPAIAAHEAALTHRLYDGLAAIPGIRILGGRENRGALISINVPGVHHYDLGTLLDQMGIAVRTGHHCCQPLMQHLGITGTTRYSLALYNTEDDIDRALTATTQALHMLR
ncbi:MAG: cysteine desulfurase [Akkermansiaceae bacterium]|nr:cysteine desulfurase [Akkermansiaceae bacterium]